MSSEFQLVVDVWSVVRDVIPANKRAEVAVGIMNAFVEFGFTSKDIVDVVDEDRDLSDAYQEIFEDEDTEEDEDY